MEQEKNKSGVIALLVVIIVILLALVILFATDTISLKIDNIYDKQSSENNTKYSYNEIKGLYKFTNENETYQLYLYDNGTFVFDLSSSLNPNIFLGNYILENNNIKLNYLFRQGSGISVTLSSGNSTLVINNDKTITGVESSITEINLKSIVLEKSTVEEEKKFVETSDFTELLNSLNKLFDAMK